MKCFIIRFANGFIYERLAQDLVLCLLVLVATILITFANSFDPNQARPIVRPDLDTNYLTLWCIPKRLLKKKCKRRKYIIILFANRFIYERLAHKLIPFLLVFNGDKSPLLITFANSFDPDQARPIGPTIGRA